MVHGKSRLQGYKNHYGESPFLWYLIHFLFFGVLEVWIKKAEMEKKTLRNGLSMSETDPLNHKGLNFAIQLGLALHQFQKKTAVKA